MSYFCKVGLDIFGTIKLISEPMQVENFNYDNRIVRNFIIASVIFGVVGMLVGVIAAIQLYYPAANFGLLGEPASTRYRCWRKYW